MGRYEAATDALARIRHPALAASRASDACEIAIHLDRQATLGGALGTRAAGGSDPAAWVEGLVEGLAV